MRWTSALIAFAVVVAPSAVPAQTPRTALERDLDGFVMASCLAKAENPALKEQGDAWAGAVVQRSHGDFEIFKTLGKVVADELALTGFGVAHRDGPAALDLPLPALTCAEMRDRPAVRRALQAARAKLSPAYRAFK